MAGTRKGGKKRKIIVKQPTRLSLLRAKRKPNR